MCRRVGESHVGLANVLQAQGWSMLNGNFDICFQLASPQGIQL